MMALRQPNILRRRFEIAFNCIAVCWRIVDLESIESGSVDGVLVVLP